MQDNVFEECYSRYLEAKPGEVFWSELAEKFGFESGEKLRKKVQKEREKRDLPNKNSGHVNTNGGLDPKNYIDKFEQEVDKEEGGESSITMNFPEESANELKEIFEAQNKTDEDMLIFHGFNIDIWEIGWVKSNGWNMPSGGGSLITCYQSKISIYPKGSKGLTLGAIENFLENYTYNPNHKKVKSKLYSRDGGVLEIPISDLHIGSLAYYDEIPYTTEQRLQYVLNNIKDKCKGKKFSKIIVPLLGDIIHIDTKPKTTTAGTLVSSDIRTHEDVFVSALDALVNFTTQLLPIAPVEIIPVPGNHDYITSFMLSKTLEVYFRNESNVFVDTNKSPRKFRLIGNTLVGFTHGNMSAKNLQNWIQVEAREEWGIAKFSEVHCGHIHHQKGIEAGGIITRFLPSLCDTDEWHYEKGFVGARKGVMSFVWGLERGLEEIWFSSVDTMKPDGFL